MFRDRGLIHLPASAPGLRRSRALRLLRLEAGGHHPQPPAHHPGARGKPRDNDYSVIKPRKQRQSYLRYLLLSVLFRHFNDCILPFKGKQKALNQSKR